MPIFRSALQIPPFRENDKRRNLMSTNDKTCTLYYRPPKKAIPVTPGFKLEGERFTGTHRKAAQRSGQCCCPFKKSRLYDAVCDGCKFRISDHVFHCTLSSRTVKRTRHLFMTLPLPKASWKRKSVLTV